MSTTFHATIEHLNHTTSRAVVRSHSMLVDRSAAKGGHDLGPAGGEYLVLALGGCFTTHLLAAIRARQADMTHVKVSASGTLDDTPERFTAFTLEVNAECSSDDLARKLIVIAGRACQVVTTLKQTAPVEILYKEGYGRISASQPSRA